MIPVLYAILSSISIMSFHIDWIKDFNIWWNAIIAELFLFQVMMVLTKKMRNTYLQTFVSVLVSLMLGQTILYILDINQISVLTLISALAFAGWLVYGSYTGFLIGLRKGYKKIEEAELESAQVMNALSAEDKKGFHQQLSIAAEFANQNPFAYKLLLKSSIEEITDFKNDLENEISE